MHRTKTFQLNVSLFTSLVTLASLTGCAGQTPRERYVEAVKARAAGDGERYYDGMIELAHEEPDSRAGRRARANLGSGMWGSLYMLAMVAGGLAGYLDADEEDDIDFLEDLEEQAPDDDDASAAEYQEGLRLQEL